MANRQLYVVGALGVLMGMVVGASSGQNAQSVSFSGSDPNDEEIRTMDTLRRADGYLRFRSTESAVDDEGRIVSRVTPPRRQSHLEIAARRLQRLHSSAPRTTSSVRGIQMNTTSPVPECAGYTRDRYTRCLEAYINGEPFQANYFPIEYAD